MTMTQEPMTIPVPANFPVAWSDPEDARKFWVQDRMHFPAPLAPVMDGFLYGRAINRAAEQYRLPVRIKVELVNGYLYMAIHPIYPPEEMAERSNEAQAAIGPVLARFGDLWRDDVFPKVRAHLAYWESFDLAGASLGRLVEHLDETARRMDDAWYLHFLVALPLLVAPSAFDDVHRDLFGGEGAFGAFDLLKGFDNLTLRAGRELWALGRRAAASPVVRGVLEENAASQVIPRLEASEEGRAFLVELRAFLAEHGQRGDRPIDLSSPSWLEDPSPVIKNLKDYVSQPDRDPAGELAATAAERDRLVAAVRERLKGYPAPVAGQYEVLLRAAQEGTVVAEDHNYWIDYRCMYEVRRVLLEIGGRLTAAGVLARADDALCLTLDELRETLLELPRIDRRRTVAGRRAQMEFFKNVPAPPVLGTIPPVAPPDNPFDRGVAKFFGPPPQPPTNPSTLRGSPGSPGRVRGRARIVRSLAEAARLGPGDILVAETTAPPWTPLFATAAAVVTDTGGILSHCAVVAREYGIPAVVGTGAATTLLVDGQLVEVDGDAGTVAVIRE